MKNSRLTIVIVMILALVAAAFTRDTARAMRDRATWGDAGKPLGAAGASSLTGMDSYALALLLGGLRGPLVMVLWTSSETQKNEKNLEDFDTKVEWIRLLQPEFDTVHIFQIWNKAYNISVQMATLSNKYSTILDALEYGHDVDRQRPGNINILTAIGQIYFDKLGGSTEKNYYRRRVREETLPHKVQVSFVADRYNEFLEKAKAAGIDLTTITVRNDEKKKTAAVTMERIQSQRLETSFSGDGITYSDVTRQKLERTDPAWRRLELDPRLSDNYTLLDDYWKSSATRPASYPADAEWSNGTELEFIKKYEPFPQGISPYAISYAYYKRCQILQNVGKQRHAQMSDLVIDSRPALSLKSWGEEEWERARNFELEAYGKPIPPEKLDKEPLTQLITLSDVAVESPIQSAIFCLKTASNLAADAIVAYQDHISRFPNNESTYQSHIDGLLGMASLCDGDRQFLEARALSGADRTARLADAAKSYRDAISRNGRIILRYYTDDGIYQQVAPPKSTRLDVPNLPDEQIEPMVAVAGLLLKGLQFDMFTEDRGEYEKYIQRAQNRLRVIDAELKKS